MNQVMLRLALGLLLPKLKILEYLTFFVTNSCQCKCAHCFYYDKFAVSGKDLSLEEIQKISSNLGNFFFLNLSGGEPFLRKDLVDIVKMFYDQNSVRQVIIPSNGYMPLEIFTAVENILKNCPEIQLSVDLSIDGIGKKHDKIRSCEGLFKRVLDTYKRLAILKKEYKNLNLGVNITYSKENQESIKKIYKHVADKIGPDTITVICCRPKSFDDEPQNLDISSYIELIEQESEYIKAHRYCSDNKIFKILYFPFYFFRKKVIVDLLNLKKANVPCLAASKSLVLNNNGDVYACEIFDVKIGNVREVDYDMKRILHSSNAKIQRKHIKKTDCSCTHECNLTVNLLFNVRAFIKILFMAVFK